MEFNIEDVFNPEEYLYFYQDFLTPERLSQEIDFLVKYTDLNKSLKILDVACGHGRHSNALAKMGHWVTGVDINTGFLNIAKENAINLGLKINYLQKDMRVLDYKEEYDRVFVMFTALGYFNDEENEKYRKIVQ
ncbi:MAG: class I SAM-dependent methyltransferase [Parachlamydiaceae bacterium]